MMVGRVRRPHWHIHFPPTSASRINQVERCFAEVTRKLLQRGVHRRWPDRKKISLSLSTRTMKTPNPSNRSDQLMRYAPR